MELESQIGRDHPVDLKQLSGIDGGTFYEHLLTFVPVEIRGGKARICFLGRSDVHILREGARISVPPESSSRPAGRFFNLAMTLRPGDVVKIGPGLMELKLMLAGRGRVSVRASMLKDKLLLNLEPLSDEQVLNIRHIIDRLNRGQDYRSDAL
jgi:hypothetical protein